MKYCFKKVNINPIKSAYAVGFAVPKEKYSETKLDLFLRLLMLEDGQNSIILASFDNLGISYDVYEELALIAKKRCPNSYLITCCTHTHYAPSLANEKPINICDEIYKDQIKNTLDEALKDIKLKEIEGYVDYHYLPFDKVGSPRISKKTAENVYAGVLSIYDSNERLGNILFYNCHPTEDDKDPGYFSGAFPADAVRRMENNHPSEFFMYMHGCAGDVSSRFTRKERSFNQTLEFGKIMAKCFDDILSKNKKNEKIELSYNHELLKLKSVFKEIPDIPQSLLDPLKEAEKRELLIGLEELKKYRTLEMPTINYVPLSRVNLGSFKLFFSPFELFSDYNGYINKDNTLLVGLSNNVLAYLLPVDNEEISYEYFLETTTNEDKRIILNAIYNL